LLAPFHKIRFSEKYGRSRVDAKDLGNRGYRSREIRKYGNREMGIKEKVRQKTDPPYWRS
jgi:hypothetical protein